LSFFILTDVCGYSNSSNLESDDSLFCPISRKERTGLPFYEGYTSLRRNRLCLVGFDEILSTRRSWSISTINLTAHTISSLNSDLSLDCSAIIFLVTNLGNKLNCPGACRPIPIIYVTKAFLFLGEDLSTGGSGLCSHTDTDAVNKAPVFSCDPTLLPRKLNCEMVSRLEYVFWRRIAECYEENYWADIVPYTAHKRKNLDGLVVWVGSSSRADIIEKQNYVMQNLASSVHSEVSLISWLATDEIYPCKPRSTSCKAVVQGRRGPIKRVYHYGHFLPFTRIPRSTFGWSCAQRRRAS